jgi:hypothetical protein
MSGDEVIMERPTSRPPGPFRRLRGWKIWGTRGEPGGPGVVRKCSLTWEFALYQLVPPTSISHGWCISTCYRGRCCNVSAIHQSSFYWC